MTYSGVSSFLSEINGKLATVQVFSEKYVSENFTMYLCIIFEISLNVQISVMVTSLGKHLC